MIEVNGLKPINLLADSCDHESKARGEWQDIAEGSQSSSPSISTVTSSHRPDEISIHNIEPKD